MNLRVFVVVTTLSSLFLSGCGGSSPLNGMTGMPAASRVAPAINDVVVTAVYGKAPIAKLEITLTRNTWPNGKLIAKGRTNSKGRVNLSGNWRTKEEIVCAGGTYQIRPGYFVRANVCQAPFPKTVKLDFK